MKLKQRRIPYEVTSRAGVKYTKYKTVLVDEMKEKEYHRLNKLNDMIFKRQV